MKKVILIDDDSLFAQYVTELLGLYGIAVKWIPDEWSVGEGLAHEEEAELIIADMMMRTSEAALSALRELMVAGGPKTPLVVLSGKNSFDGLSRASSMGALGYFLKPPDPSSFVIQIQDLMGGVSSLRRSLVGPAFHSVSESRCWVAVHFRDAPELGNKLYNWSIHNADFVFPKFRFGRFTPLPQQSQWFLVEVEFTGNPSEGIRFAEFINERKGNLYGAY